MDSPISPNPSINSENSIELDSSTGAEKYIASDKLKYASQVAQLLGRPILLTGEPGTGKTEFANWLAWKLHREEPDRYCPKPLQFNTKSTSTARELFYTYDTLKQFQDAQNQAGKTNALDYITYQAFGQAILRTTTGNWSELVPKRGLDEIEPYRNRRSVVLIDEIDKAPRDFPNDLLNELESYSFWVPELDRKIIANSNLKPTIVITSNSEKDLPDAFLRRCIYHHIEPPNRQKLLEIVSSQLGTFLDRQSQFLQQALELYEELRKPEYRLTKKPATSEFLQWIQVLNSASGKIDQLFAMPSDQLEEIALSVLVKRKDDLETARNVVTEWIQTLNP